MANDKKDKKPVAPLRKPTTGKLYENSKPKMPQPKIKKDK